jgi:uncharacterized protein (TIGR02421 family)
MSVEAEKARIEKVSELLYHAAKKQNILAHIAWDPEVGKKFLAGKGRELPQVSYEPFDPTPAHDLVKEARTHLGNSSEIDLYFHRVSNAIENGANLLKSCGTQDFYKYSRELFGTPNDLHQDGHSTARKLAEHFSKVLGSLEGVDLGAPPEACNLATYVAEKIQHAVVKAFGEQAPEIQIVDSLSANAIAGRRRIRLRRHAHFTDKDIAQLIHHEAHIHVATSLNGAEQASLKHLGVGHPGTTKTQEGLAVFSELITGSMDLDRLHRLSNRVIAVQMAIDGADFLEVYQYFLDRVGVEETAYENAMRVFRGGVLTGGAPLTKDIVYLEGLIRVHNFLRAIVSSGRADCLRILFCGKLDIDDIPVLWELEKMGLCKAAKYLPPWASDVRFLFSYLAYSSFLNGMDLEPIKLHYNDLLRNLPQKAA